MLTASLTAKTMSTCCPSPASECQRACFVCPMPGLLAAEGRGWAAGGLHGEPLQGHSARLPVAPQRAGMTCRQAGTAACARPVPHTCCTPCAPHRSAPSSTDSMGINLDPQFVRDLTVLIAASAAAGVVMGLLGASSGRQQALQQGGAGSAGCCARGRAAAKLRPHLAMCSATRAAPACLPSAPLPRAGQPAINGYFVAGSLVGPGGFKLIKEIVQVGVGGCAGVRVGVRVWVCGWTCTHRS